MFDYNLQNSRRYAIESRKMAVNKLELLHKQHSRFYIQNLEILQNQLTIIDTLDSQQPLINFYFQNTH